MVTDISLLQAVFERLYTRVFQKLAGEQWLLASLADDDEEEEVVCTNPQPRKGSARALETHIDIVCE